MSDVLKVGIAGLGTVGTGTVKIIQNNAELLARRCGRRIEVVAVSARSKGRDRGVNLDAYRWYDNAIDLASDPDVDVVVELIGGSEGVARELCEKAIANGKHVVTANKALIAHHGTALAKAAEQKGVAIGYEASVAGGIPIIKALREGLTANSISKVCGILNGTCNYILTAMRETGRDFDDILAEAQELGYAEADPSFDVDGVDAAHKLAILSSVAFGTEINFKALHIEGIRHITALDIRLAEQLGYRIKLLGIATRTAHGIEQRVHPCMVPLSAPIAKVEGVFNAVVAEGDFVDSTMYQGRGAGEGPTASAVVADIADIARGNRVPILGIPTDNLAPFVEAPMAKHEGAYYIRLMVVDQPGVFADIATVLKDYEVSMESVLQHSRSPGGAVPVVMTLHETREEVMAKVLSAIAALGTVVEPPRMIRVEPL